MDTVTRAFSSLNFRWTPTTISSRVRKGFLGLSAGCLFYIAKFELKKQEEKARIALKKERLSMVLRPSNRSLSTS